MKTNKFMHKLMPTFSQEDLERINRSGLTKKESNLWAVWTFLEAFISFEIILLIVILVSLGITYLSTKSELATFIVEAKTYVAQVTMTAAMLFSFMLIPYGYALADSINSHKYGVISFSVFLDSYTEDKSRWDILSNHSVALFGQGSYFGRDRYKIMFFPPWERLRIAMRINKLQK